MGIRQGGAGSNRLSKLALATLAVLSTNVAAQEFLNSGFEEPFPGSTTPGIQFFQVDENAVVGWETSATDGLIEIWDSGFLGVTSFEGAFHAELNATQPSTLFQTIDTSTGDILRLQFAHRGRDNGAGVQQDTMRVRVVDVATGAVLAEQIVTSDETAWTFTTVPDVLATGASTRLEFTAVSSGGGLTFGNFLDAILLTITGTTLGPGGTLPPGALSPEPVAPSAIAYAVDATVGADMGAIGQHINELWPSGAGLDDHPECETRQDRPKDETRKCHYWHMFAIGAGRWTERDDSDDSDALSSFTDSAIVGAERWFPQHNALVGVAGSVSNFDMKIGETNADYLEGNMASLYGFAQKRWLNNVSARLMVGGGYGEVDTEDNGVLTATTQAKGETHLTQFAADLRLGRYYRMGSRFVEPYVGTRYVLANVDAYEEDGAGSLDRTYSDYTGDTALAYFGVNILQPLMVFTRASALTFDLQGEARMMDIGDGPSYRFSSTNNFTADALEPDDFGGRASLGLSIPIMRKTGEVFARVSGYYGSFETVAGEIFGGVRIGL